MSGATKVFPRLAVFTLAGLALLPGCFRAADAPLGVMPVLPSESSAAAERSGMAEPEEFDIRCLAVITGNSASVYGEPRVYAAVVGKVERGQYVIAETGRGELVGVRMVDGEIGWMRADALMLLDISSEPEAAVDFPDFEPPGDKPVYHGGSSVVTHAYAYLGIPYVWGGTSNSGMDCSGFVQRVFRESSVELPRVAADQAGVGMPVSQSMLRAGDRVYFQSGHEIDHTGIYIGDDHFIHCSSSGGGVVIDDLTQARWQRIYAGARR